MPAILAKIEYFNQKRLKVIIDNDKILAENKVIDNNKITMMVLLSFVLQTIKLVIIIMNISYFLGMIWYIICDLNYEYFLDEDGNAMWKGQQFNDGWFFLTNFELANTKEITYRTIFDKIIILTYFAFTSLSTVGFGDYHPRSNVERVTGAFILLFGVAIFSYIMGNFIEILGDYQNLNADLDDGDNLT